MITQATELTARSLCFTAADRVRQSRDYLRSRAHGRRASTRTFALEITPNARTTRLGLVVSRRVGGAVVRNRVKRGVREWFRSNRSRLPVAVDLVVIARTGAGALTVAAMHIELNELVQRATR